MALLIDCPLHFLVSKHKSIWANTKLNKPARKLICYLIIQFRYNKIRHVDKLGSAWQNDICGFVY